MPYEEIVKDLGIKAAQKSGYGCQKLCNTLNAHNTENVYRFKKMVPELSHLLNQDNIIVFIERSPSRPYGHYLARVNDRWMDPWINLVEDLLLQNAESGFRKELPGLAAFIIFPS
jgi:ABC-type uncharacterized transport system auxiliary subunit